MDIDGVCLFGLNPLTELLDRGGSSGNFNGSSHGGKTMIRHVWLVPLFALVMLLAAGVGWPIEVAAQEKQAGSDAKDSDGKVNINTASKAELMKLDGVGPAVAAKIIEYRNANGPFKKPEDIRKVRGFGKGLWEKNRAAIAVK